MFLLCPSCSSHLELGLLGRNHKLRADVLVKVLLADDLELHGGFLQCKAVLVCVLCGLGRGVVADDGVEAGNKHEPAMCQQGTHNSLVRKWRAELAGAGRGGEGVGYLRLSQQRTNALLIRLKTGNKVLLETPHAVSQQARAVQQVADHDRLEDVQLKVTLRAGKGGRGVVAEDLCADHGQGLALCGVDLARHDGRARLVLRQLQLAETATRAGAEEANVLCNLEERGGEGVELAVGFDNGIVGGEGLELVGGGDEFVAGHFGNLGSNVLGKALEGVDTSSNGCSSLSKHPKAGQR